MEDDQVSFGELTRKSQKDKSLFLLTQLDSGISKATLDDYMEMHENLYPIAHSSADTASNTRREVDTPINMFSETVMEHAERMQVVLSLLARRFATTDGKEGVRLKPRQVPLIRLMMAGLTKARLGDVNLARYLHRIQHAFRPTKITDRIFDKAGRRKGKTFVFCVFAAIALLTQPRCNGISVAFDATNALVNRECVQAIMMSIVNDPLQNLSDRKIHTFAKSSNLYLRVEFPDGSSNTCRFTPSPESTNFRGSGSAGGFFHLDEADFISAKAFERMHGIWSMQIIIIMTSSQGYALSKATEMALSSVLANGQLTWYIVYSQADKVTQVLSDDYVHNQAEDPNMKYIMAGAMPTDADRSEAVAKNVIQEHKKRPWYDPICANLEKVRIEFLERIKEKEKMAENEKRRRERLFSSSSAATASIGPVDPELKRAEMRTISRDRLHDYIRGKNALNSSVATDENRSAQTKGKGVDPFLVVTEPLNYELLIFLFTLPDQQSPAQMLRVLSEMPKDVFDREMLNKMPQINEAMHATFDRKELEDIFNPLHFIDDFDIMANGYLHWIIAYDPGMNGRSSDAIFGSLLFQNPPSDDPNEIASLFDMLDSESLRQRMVLTGADKIEGAGTLDIDETARRMIAHILKLCEVYPNQQQLTFWIVPESNISHVSYNLPIKIAAQLANLKNDPRIKIKVPELKSLYTSKQLQSPVPLSGVHTSNASKTTGIMRLAARFNRGPRSFAISNRFITTTPRADTPPGEPVRYWSPQEMIGLIFEHLTSLQTIPPALNSRSQAITYSAKVINKKDDGFSMLLSGEMGNATLLAEQKQNPLFVQH